MKQPHSSWRKYAALLALLAMIIIYSCRKGNEINTAESKATAVSDARSWYEKSFPLKASNGRYGTMDLSTAAQATQGDLSQLIRPDWEHSEVYSRLGKEVIELPLDSAIRLGFVNDATTAETFNAAKSSSKCSFIILHNAQGYQAYVMTIMADAAWLGSNYGKLKQLSYRNKGEAFSGKVLYFNPKGRLIDGYRYYNGKVNGRVSAAPPLTDNKQVQAMLKAVNSRKKEMTESCSTEVIRVLSSIICAAASSSTVSCVYNYDVYIIRTCYQMGDLPVMDDDGYTPPQEGGGTTTTTVEHDSVVVEPVATITNNVKDSCLKKMVDAAVARDIQYDLTQSMNSIFGKSTAFNLIFVDEVMYNNDGTINTKTDGTTGVLSSTGNYNSTQQRYVELYSMNIKIALNSSTLPNSTEEYVTATILHEALHAYFRAMNISFDHDIMVRQYVPWYELIMHSIFPTMTAPDLRGLAYGGLMSEAAFTTSSEYAMKNAYSIINDSYKEARSGTACH